MLRNNIISLSSSPDTHSLIEKSLTIEDIENFYRIITIGAYDTSTPYSGTNILLQKNYFEYIIKYSNTSVSEQKLTDAKCRILIGQINALDPFFIDKIDSCVLESVKEDLKTNGKILRSLLNTDTKEDLVIQLQTIADDSMSRLAPKPSVIVHRNLAWAYYRRAHTFYEQSNWAEAHNQYSLAILSINNIDSSLRSLEDSQILAVLYRRSAVALTYLAMQYFNLYNYDECIKKHKEALLALANIPPSLLIEEDTRRTDEYLRYLSHVLNKRGETLINAKKFDASIETYHELIPLYRRINEKNESDALMLSIYYRCLAYSYSERGETYRNQSKFSQSLKEFDHAMQFLNDIPSKHKTEEDWDLYEIISLNKSRSLDEVNRLNTLVLNTYNLFQSIKKTESTSTDKKKAVQDNQLLFKN